MKIKVRKGFITQRKGDTLTIFDAEQSQLYTFNSTATYIFSKLKDGIETEKIIKSLTMEYGIDENKAKADFDEFIKDLTGKKIVNSDKNAK